jgi:hypothetical protein
MRVHGGGAVADGGLRVLGRGLLGFHRSRYEGDFRDGKIHGRGIKTWPDGAR